MVVHPAGHEGGESMKISIAMATYNGERWLQEQLASFTTQTRLPDELVVTDDRSSDSTLTVLEDFALTAPFAVRAEANPGNLGFAQNFGRALALCSGDLVFLCDQDDAWLDEKIERIVSEVRQRPDKACFMNDAFLADGDLRPTGQTKLGQIRATGVGEENFVMGCCAAIRRPLLDLVLPIPTGIPAHDSWIVQVSDVLGLTVRIDVPLQYYRRHGGNVSKFFVNDIDRMPPLRRLGVRLTQTLANRTSSANLDRERMFMSAISDRLGERRAAVADLVGPDRAARIEADLRRRVKVLDRRRSVRNAGVLARPGALYRLWREGGYRISGGLKGMLKDALASGPSPEEGR